MADKKKERLTMLLQRISEAENYRRSNYEEKWLNWYRLYRSRLANSNKNGSNVFVPQTAMMIDVVRSRLAQSVFDSRPYVAVFPRSEDEAEKAEKVQTLLDWQLSERMDVARIFKEEVILDLCVYGTAVIYTGWRKKTRKTKRMMTEKRTLMGADNRPLFDSETGDEITVTERYVGEEQEVVYDDPDVTCISLFDFFVDPAALTIEDARFCGHREFLTKAEIQQLEKTAGWKVDWRKLQPVDSYDNGWQKLQEEMGQGSFTEDYNAKSPLGKYEVHHYWEEDRHVVIIDRQQLVLDEENPYWHGLKPYDKCAYMPEGRSFYGIGIPELVHCLQDELNTVRNQRIDYCSQALRRMWKVRKGSGLTPADLIWRQNGLIWIDNMDDVLEIPVAQIPASAFSNEALIKEDMRYATGCHDILMGVSAADETATTTMTKDNNASIRFKDLVMSISQQLLVSMAKKCISLDQEFLNESRAVRLLDTMQAKRVLEVSPYDLDGKFDLIYVGSAIEPMANEEQKREHMIRAYQMLASDPLYQSSPEKKIALMNELLQNLGIEDPIEILPSLPPPQPMPQEAGMAAAPQGAPPAALLSSLMGGA